MTQTDRALALSTRSRLAVAPRCSMSILLATTLLLLPAACEKSPGTKERAESSGKHTVSGDEKPVASPPNTDPSANQATDNVPVIVALGDSLTEGFGVPEEQNWPSRLQRRLAEAGYPHRVVNAGISGDTSAGGLARMDWLLRQRVDILIVELGANDGLRGIDPNVTRRNLSAIIEQGKSHGVTVVLAGMRMAFNVGPDYLRRFNGLYPKLAEQHGVAFIPFILEGVATRRDLNQSDGIHPTGEGYELVTENVWKVLQPLLKKS
jgi:acyl-CoA thioesterase-1